MSQSQVPQQQQQQQQPQTSNNMLSISQQPHKEINIVTLSRVGQETVQDITSRFQEIFTALKVIQPTASRDNGTVKKVQEHFRTIRLLFKRMRLIYERCSDGYPQGKVTTNIYYFILICVAPFCVALNCVFYETPEIIEMFRCLRNVCVIRVIRFNRLGLVYNR